jgi:hypothetical protein
MHYLSSSGGPGTDPGKKCDQTHYVELVFLDLARYVAHVVRSGMSRALNINAIFFMLERARCGSQKKHTRTCYAVLALLH